MGGPSHLVCDDWPPHPAAVAASASAAVVVVVAATTAAAAAAAATSVDGSTPGDDPSKQAPAVHVTIVKLETVLYASRISKCSGM